MNPRPKSSSNLCESNIQLQLIYWSLIQHNHTLLCWIEQVRALIDEFESRICWNDSNPKPNQARVRSKGYNQNFGDESKLYLQFGRNNDGDLNQRNVIDELSRQVAILIERYKICNLQFNVVMIQKMLKFNLSILLIL